MLERTVSVKWSGCRGVLYSQRETEGTGLRIGRENPMRQQLVPKRKMLEKSSPTFKVYLKSAQPGHQLQSQSCFLFTSKKLSCFLFISVCVRGSALFPATSQSLKSTTHVFCSSLGLECPPLILAPVKKGTVLAGCQCLGRYPLCFPEVNDPLASGIPFSLNPFYLSCSFA